MAKHSAQALIEEAGANRPFGLRLPRDRSGREKRLQQSFCFRPESAFPGVGIMWMFDLKHGVEMGARFAGSALFDEESSQDEMGIGITSVRRNRAPQIRFGLFLATAQQPGQLRIEASHHLQRLRMARIEFDRPTDMFLDFPQHQPGIGDGWD